MTLETGPYDENLNLPNANFLTPAEFGGGPDLLRPGTRTGKNVSPDAIAFVYTAFPFAGDDGDLRLSPLDARLVSWPAAMGHEQVADREPVLRALFGPDYQAATASVAYEHEVYETDEGGQPKRNAEGELIVIGKKLAYDAVELRRLAIKENLFGRFGDVRGVPCLMLWNRCPEWMEMVDRLLVLLGLPDSGLITLGNTEQWWAGDYRRARQGDQR